MEQIECLPHWVVVRIKGDNPHKAVGTVPAKQYELKKCWLPFYVDVLHLLSVLKQFLSDEGPLGLSYLTLGPR